MRIHLIENIPKLSLELGSRHRIHGTEFDLSRLAVSYGIRRLLGSLASTYFWSGYSASGHSGTIIIDRVTSLLV